MWEHRIKGKSKLTSFAVCQAYRNIYGYVVITNVLLRGEGQNNWSRLFCITCKHYNLRFDVHVSNHLVYSCSSGTFAMLSI